MEIRLKKLQASVRLFKNKLFYCVYRTGLNRNYALFSIFFLFLTWLLGKALCERKYFYHLAYSKLSISLLQVDCFIHKLDSSWFNNLIFMNFIATGKLYLHMNIPRWVSHHHTKFPYDVEIQISQITLNPLGNRKYTEKLLAIIFIKLRHKGRASTTACANCCAPVLLGNWNILNQ